MFLIRSSYGLPINGESNLKGSMTMQQALRHDVRLRAAASLIYGAVYPSEDWAPVSFIEAERRDTVHYRQAVEAARLVRPVLTDHSEQLALL